MGCATAEVDFVSPTWLVLPSWDREMCWDDQRMGIAIAGVCQSNLSWAVEWVQARGGHAEGRKRRKQLKIAVKTR